MTARLAISIGVGLYFAFCGRDGVIRFGNALERGTLFIASASASSLRRACERWARLAYDNHTLLVPGVPEAASELAALAALALFSERVSARLAKGGAA